MRQETHYEIKPITSLDLKDLERDGYDEARREFISYPTDLANALVDIGIESFGSSMGREEVLQHLKGQEMFVVYGNGKPAGFASMSYGTDVVPVAECSITGHRLLLSNEHKRIEAYLSAAFVKRSERGNGLYKALTKARLKAAMDYIRYVANDSDVIHFYISTRTQNPNVEAGITSALKEMTEEKGELISFGKAERTLIAGAYGRMLTDEIPLTSDDGLNAEYAKLDYKKGDAYLLRFSVNTKETRVRNMRVGARYGMYNFNGP